MASPDREVFWGEISDQPWPGTTPWPWRCSPVPSQHLPAAPSSGLSPVLGPCVGVFPVPGRDVMEGGNVSHSYQVIHCPGPVLNPPSSRALWEDPEPSFLFLQSLQHCQKGKGTIWLALVYCTPCQFELINHIYPSILITPCLATCLALSC